MDDKLILVILRSIGGSSSSDEESQTFAGDPSVVSLPQDDKNIKVTIK